MPELVVHLHLHYHVAGVEQPLAGYFLAIAQFDNFLFRNQNLPDLSGEAERIGARPQRIRNFAFEARVGMDDVPLPRVVPWFSRGLRRGFRLLLRSFGWLGLLRNSFYR